MRRGRSRREGGGVGEKGGGVGEKGGGVGGKRKREERDYTRRSSELLMK